MVVKVVWWLWSWCDGCGGGGVVMEVVWWLWR